MGARLRDVFVAYRFFILLEVRIVNWRNSVETGN